MGLYLHTNGRILSKSQLLNMHMFTVFGLFSKQYREVFRIYCMDETDISFSPSIVGGSKISYELLEGVNLSLLSKLVGKQYIDNSGSDEHILALMRRCCCEERLRSW